MIRPLLLAAALVCAAVFALGAAEGPVVDSMDELRFRPPREKGRAELVAGKHGKAVRFSFDKDARSAFFTSPIRGTPAWDKAAGLSFWVKGDGADCFGGLQLIYDDDYSLRYDFAFPVKGTEWTRVTVAWGDFIPVLPGPKARPLDPAGPNKPSKVSALWVGRWWYWGDYPAHSFAIDEIRLEPTIERDVKDYRPDGPPLARTLAKLKAGKPVTVVTMGDSLTDFRHWANRKVSWPNLLKERLKKEYGSDVTALNPAVGGTQLRQNLVLIPLWLDQVPEPDLVTICFGGNDWEAGMRGPEFARVCAEAVDRVRRATKGRADVLLITTTPSATRWEATKELAEACRQAARERNAGIADTEAAFHAAGKEYRERLYVDDKVHLGPAGHELFAETVRKAIASGGK